MPGTVKNKIAAKSQHPEQEKEALAKKDIITVYRWAPAGILLFTAAIYMRALQNGLTSIDDDYYILKNPFLKDFSLHGIKEIFTSFYSYNYHPFTTLSYLFEYTFFGTDPLPYHLLNVALHVFNTWLVYKLAESLGGKKITALVTSLLFAIHPMHVESVAWISERKDVLYTFFYLLSLLQYLRYLHAGFKRKHYWWALLFFSASLFSKSAAVTLPLLLIAIDIYKHRKVNSRSLLEKAPFLLLSVAFGILNIMAQAQGGAISATILSAGIINRMFLFTSALAFYFIKLVAPFGLSAMHYFPKITNGMLPWEYYLSLPLILAMSWFVARRSIYRREVVFGISFFLITISVMLQIVAVGSTLTAERYTYVPYVGLFYIVGQWCSGIEKARVRTIALWVMGVAVILFSILSWLRIGVWKDDETLFKDIADRYPGVYLQYYNIGNDKKNISHLREAVQQYSVAILLNPGFAAAYTNRAEVYDRLQDDADAMADYNKAISIDAGNAKAYNGRGMEYSKTGDLKPAIRDFDRAIILDAAYTEAYNNRGWMYYQLGNAGAAMLDYQKSIALDTGYSMAYNNMGWAYYNAGKKDTAMFYFNKAILHNPGNNFAISNRALIEANTGDLAGATADYNTLVKLNPKDNMTYYTRGMLRFYLKDTSGAKADWKTSAAIGNQNAANLLKK
jgi:tetratricopeptide (TPR) repeat protein